MSVIPKFKVGDEVKIDDLPDCPWAGETAKVESVGELYPFYYALEGIPAKFMEFILKRVKDEMCDSISEQSEAGNVDAGER